MAIPAKKAPTRRRATAAKAARPQPPTPKPRQRKGPVASRYRVGIFEVLQRMGGQLTPEQARSAADEMIKLMQQQVPKDVAMMMAISSVVRTMAGLAQRWGQMIGMANGAQRAADGIRQQMEAVGPQMGAQNVGFP